MSYTPTNWQTGDTITAEKLNHMESGIENANNPFIITLTPTAEDFSGTMDKTVAEINEAYEAGQEIWFSITTQKGTYKVKCREIGTGSFQYPSFNGMAHLDSLGAMVFVYTGTTDDGTKQTYLTHIYPLTPMS